MNASAESLMHAWSQSEPPDSDLMDEALAAERRATVERISNAIDRITLDAPSAARVEGYLEVLGAVQAILDEEAAR